MVVVAGKNDQAIKEMGKARFLRLMSGDKDVHIQQLRQGVDMRLGVTTAPDKMEDGAIFFQGLQGEFAFEYADVEFVHVMHIREGM